MRIIDLHVHAGPSVMPRDIDGIDMFHEAVSAGYRAFIIKDHYFPTMMNAKIIEDHFGKGNCRVFGGIALNNSIGGLNLKAVDTACALGAKIVWMPTVSSLRHKTAHEGHGLAFPSSSGITVTENPIYYLNDTMELSIGAKEIVMYLADRDDVILATGHGSRDEVNALIEFAHEKGVKRILVNHPHYMIDASLDDMIRWSRLGAYIELNATVFVPTSRFCTNDMAEVKDIIGAVGVDRIVIDSDYGQKGNGSPVAGLSKFVQLVRDECGLTDEQIDKMCYVNPAWLLNIQEEENE